MGSALLRQVTIRRCRSGMPLGTTSSLIEVTQAWCMPLPGHLMGSILLLGQGTAILMGWIMVCTCGIPPLEIRSTSIVVIVMVYMLWHGHPMGSVLPRQARG